MIKNGHFTIGKNFHETLLEVSREHLTNKDVKKAIEIFTLGLGTTNEMAIDVIKGHMKLGTNVESQELYVEENKKGDQWFEKEFKDILKYKIKTDIENFSYLHTDLLNVLQKFVKKCVGKDDDYNINVELNVDFKTYITNGEVKVDSTIPELIEKSKKLINDLNNYHNLAVFGIDTVELDDLFISSENCIDRFSCGHIRRWNVKNFYDCEFNLCLAINNITNYNYRKAKNYINDCDCSSLPGLCSVETYINTLDSLDQRDLSIPVHFYGDNILSHRFNDTYKYAYDAYWIDREGNAYGADGPTAAMLHINIADAICKNEIKNNVDSSSILERKGYVKMSKDWVLYTADYMDLGDDNEMIKKPLEPMTDKQVDTVVRIISQGFRISETFWVGYSKQLMNITKFKNMEPLMRNNLFKL
jgi:hypothetical protein